MNPAVELCPITEPTDEIADLSVGTAFRFQYFVYCKVSVAIDVDLLNFQAIKFAFYRFAIQVFQRIRRRICGYARLDLEQFTRPSVSITFVKRRVTRLGDADRVSDVGNANALLLSFRDTVANAPAARCRRLRHSAPCL